MFVLICKTENKYFDILYGEEEILLFIVDILNNKFNSGEEFKVVDIKEHEEASFENRLTQEELSDIFNR